MSVMADRKGWRKVAGVFCVGILAVATMIGWSAVLADEVSQAVTPAAPDPPDCEMAQPVAPDEPTADLEVAEGSEEADIELEVSLVPDLPAQPAAICRMMPQCDTDADCDPICGAGQGRCVRSRCPVRVCKCS
jgi:hypothetical protein